jgi:hypothetical protein
VNEALKWLHVGAVVASGAGFLARAAPALAGSRLLRRPLTRIAPHVVDTVLLAAGAALAVPLRLSPATQPWLPAKMAPCPFTSHSARSHCARSEAGGSGCARWPARCLPSRTSSAPQCNAISTGRSPSAEVQRPSGRN